MKASFRYMTGMDWLLADDRKLLTSRAPFSSLKGCKTSIGFRALPFLYSFCLLFITVKNECMKPMLLLLLAGLFLMSCPDDVSAQSGQPFSFAVKKEGKGR